MIDRFKKALVLMDLEGYKEIPIQVTKEELQEIVSALSLEMRWKKRADAVTREDVDTDCSYCHEDSDGWVRVLEKNGHAVIYGNVLDLKAKGWRGEVTINFCPMCGRRLKR